MHKKVHVKKGNIVKIIAGKYKGEVGEVIKVIPKTQKVIIKNINLKTKHSRSKQENQAGKIIQIEAPIHSSNVMLYSQKYNIASRYKYIFHNNKKIKILQKTKENI